jgi:hypothetical protein
MSFNERSTFSPVQAVMNAASIPAARTALGASTVGNAVFVAADATAAQTAVGMSAIGKAVAVSASTAAALSAIGATATGSALVQASSAAVARTALSLGYVNVKDYGAVGDGVADDTAEFAAAIAAGDAIYIPDGTYLISAALAISSSKRIFSDSGNATIKLAASMSANLFDITGSDVKFSNFKVEGDGTQTNALFHLKTASASMARIYIDDVIASNCYRFCDDDNSSGTATSLFIYRSQHKQPRERALYFRDVSAYLFVNRFDVDYVGVSAASSNVPGIEVQNNAGCEFVSVNVTGGTIAAMSGRHGFRFLNCSAVWNTLCMADTMGGRGFSYESVTGLHLDQVTASLCDLHGIYMTGCNTVMGQKLYAGGRNALTGTGSQHGLYITGASDLINITGVNSQNNTGNGILIDNTSIAGICSLRATSNTGRGYKTAGTASILNGAQFKANTAGNYDLGGTLDHIIGAQLNSGALVTDVTGVGVG